MSNETTQEGTSGYQGYAADVVGKAMDTVNKQRGSDVYAKTENKEENFTEESTSTRSADSTQGANFEDFATAELDNQTFQTQETYKGLNYNEITSELPEDAQKLLANFRSDYTRKTQELSRQRKALEEERKALLESDFAKNIAEKAQAEVTVDPFDEATIEARIEQEVAKRMNEMLNPLKEQYELQQNQYQLEKFKAENPDLGEYRQDIAKLLLQNENLNLQQAYFIVKGKAQNAKTRQLEQELSSYKSQAKEYGLMIGGTSRSAKQSVPDNIKQQGGYAIYQWLQANKKSK